MFRRQEKDPVLARSILRAMNHDQGNLDLASGSSKREIEKAIRDYKKRLEQMGYRVSLGPDGYWSAK